MGDNANKERVLLGADEARVYFYEKSKKNKSKLYQLITVLAIISAIVITAVVGIVMTFGGIHSLDKKLVDSIYRNGIDDHSYILSENEKSIGGSWSEVESLVSDKIKVVYDKYRKGTADFDDVRGVINAFSQIPEAAAVCSSYGDLVDKIEVGRRNFELSKDQIIDNDYVGALISCLSVSSEDELYYNEAMEKAKSIENKSRDGISYTVNEYLCKYDIDGARSFLDRLSGNFGDTSFIDGEKQRVEEYYNFQNDLYVYTAPIEHLFTHCLIAYPEICYSSPTMTRSLDTDCITPTELVKILESLYANDYILIDINLLINENGDNVTFNKVEVPKGKKPFVFSIDDVTYDSKKMHTGMVDKLIVDENGRVCTYTRHTDGTEVISYENEVFPIVDEYVRQHPDFTFRGARGTLCHTGFDGVFGYRTQNNPKENVDSQVERAGALEVAKALREEGWNFASHSYAHAQMGDCTVEFVKNDTDKWISEVASIVGETKVMVWPYGNTIRSGEAHKYMFDKGFKLFCGVGADPYNVPEPDGYGIFMDRKALDGYSLRNRRERYLYLFDTEAVWDPLRPKEVTW